MSEPRSASEGRTRSGADTDRTRGNGQQQRAADRTSWAEPAAQLRQQQMQLGQAAGETAGVIFQDWSSTMMALYGHNLAIASRRARAMADLWEALAQARQPSDAMSAVTNYWSRMIGDYSNFAVGEGGAMKELMAGGRRR